MQHGASSSRATCSRPRARSTPVRTPCSRSSRRLGAIQFDPLGVAGRNHDLVLHARVADYDPAWCVELLYERRELFEAYNKSLSPAADERASLVPREREPGVVRAGILAENREVAERVLERIRAEGPLSTLDFERGPRWTGPRAPTNVVRAVLEAYAIMGVLGLARRDGQPPLLRPRRASVSRRAARARGAAHIAAATQAPLALSCSWPLGDARLRRDLARQHGLGEAERELARTIRRAPRCAPSSSSGATSSRSRSRA